MLSLLKNKTIVPFILSSPFYIHYIIHNLEDKYLLIFNPEL